MTVLEFRRPRNFRPFQSIRDRLDGDLRGLTTRLAHTMREGEGGVNEQFLRQGELKPEGGFVRWKQSKRAKKVGGFTLIATGAYRRAWRGGEGSITRSVPSGDGVEVIIGVDTAVFPQASVFQADGPTTIKVGLKNVERVTVDPRRVSVNPKMTRAMRRDVERYFFTGAA